MQTRDRHVEAVAWLLLAAICLMLGYLSWLILQACLCDPVIIEEAPPLGVQGPVEAPTGPERSILVPSKGNGSELSEGMVI